MTNSLIRKTLVDTVISEKTRFVLPFQRFQAPRWMWAAGVELEICAEDSHCDHLGRNGCRWHLACEMAQEWYLLVVSATGGVTKMANSCPFSVFVSHGQSAALAGADCPLPGQSLLSPLPGPLIFLFLHWLTSSDSSSSRSSSPQALNVRGFSPQTSLFPQHSLLKGGSLSFLVSNTNDVLMVSQ